MKLGKGPGEPGPAATGKEENMSDTFFTKTRCDRCGGSLEGGRIMSMYNTQVICMECKAKEQRRPDYREAVEADNEAIRRGDRNFPGISLKKK